MKLGLPHLLVQRGFNISSISVISRCSYHERIYSYSLPDKYRHPIASRHDLVIITRRLVAAHGDFRKLLCQFQLLRQKEC